ncbi:MAG: hypothetical protein B7Z81_03060 [Acidocella sp. 20-61-6]|nr:MAG: hypothetical protein B7Z81_03060 [Acidocella sp. 20-61-6]
MAVGLVSTRLTLPRRWAVTGEVLAMVALGWACVDYDVMLVPLAAAALIWMLRHEAGPVARLLSGRVPVYLGEISFSIYLVHMPLLRVYQAAWPVQRHTPLSPMFVSREMLYFVLLFALASLAYRFIEHPARQLGRGGRRVLARVPA